MYETLKAHCNVHVPRVQEHPRLARQNRPSRRERKAKELKQSLKRMCKKAVRDGESLHERSQLSRQWRNATKARRKLRIERELKEKARKRANEHRRFKADRYKEVFDPPNSAQPTFAVDEAFTHFVETNTGKQRSTVLNGRGQRHLSTSFCYQKHCWTS